MFREYTWRDVLYPSLVSGGLIAALRFGWWLCAVLSGRGFV